MRENLELQSVLIIKEINDILFDIEYALYPENFKKECSLYKIKEFIVNLNSRIKDLEDNIIRQRKNWWKIYESKVSICQ